MLVALYGEIKTLDNFLWMESSRGKACLESGIPLEIQSFRIPRDIFDANNAALGELRDIRLVAHLVELYAIAEHTNEKARQLETGNGEVNFKSLRYLQDLANCLGSAVICHAWLKKHTSHIKELDDQADPSSFQQEHQNHLNVADGLAAIVERRLSQQTPPQRPPE